MWVRDPDSGKPQLLNQDEEHAFWAWAVIEVFRHTGIRVEELLELNHHSLVQYRLPSTGELVPLLQIAPSKTDTERLLVVSPELAEVLSAIICRVRRPDGTIPMVRARDSHELVWLPPAPLLFQRRVGTENHSLSGTFVADLLDEALTRTGLTDPATEQQLRFTAHDFRRIFITDAVLNGLPPHIAQIIAGHRDIGVTMGYKAVYPEEAITAHRAFIARRRAQRPTEEYRQPTDEEWQHFLGHFERRKVSIGTCGRAFGTNCIHEHACVRCSLLWPDPDQHRRLMEIRDNLKARIVEAQHEGWLGEVEGLQVSLAGAEEKLAQLRRRNTVPPETPPSQRFPDRNRPTAKVMIEFREHLKIGKALYSVPWRLMGQQVHARAAGNTVQILHQGKVVATHVQLVRGRATDFEHYPPEKIAFHMRTPAWCRQQAEKIGPATAAVIGELMEVNALHRLRSAQGIIGLADRPGVGNYRLEAACDRALAVGDPSYRTIKGILAAGTETLTPTATTAAANTPAFLRGPDELLA